MTGAPELPPQLSVPDMIQEIVLANRRVVFIGSDLGAGMFARLGKEAPDRFFMEGVSEQHLIGMAAGLAKEGFIPLVMTIATFLTRRCYEQIVVDAALHGLPVRLLGIGSGLAYAALGPTHVAVDDFALLRPVPGMTVLAPADTVEANALLAQSINHPGPVYLRLPRGDEVPMPSLATSVIGVAAPLHEPGEVLIVSTGALTATAIAVRESLRSHGVNAGVLHVHTVAPLDAGTVCTLAVGMELVVTVEEHLRTGGLGSAVLEALHDARISPMPAVLRRGADDGFVTGYGTREEQLAGHRLSADALTADIAAVMRDGRPAAPVPLPGPAE